MRTILLCLLSLYLLSGTAPALAEPESEIDALRSELQQMRADYEARILTHCQPTGELKRRMDEHRRAREEALVIAALERAAEVAKGWWSPTMQQGHEQAERLMNEILQGGFSIGC